nr:MAG TPA: hypothetical protein [Caudoviricetes sp.]
MYTRKPTIWDKSIKCLTKISVFITVMTILISVPACVIATVYYTYNGSLLSVFYALITLLLLKIREKVVG